MYWTSNRRASTFDEISDAAAAKCINMCIEGNWLAKLHQLENDAGIGTNLQKLASERLQGELSKIRETNPLQGDGLMLPDTSFSSKGAKRTKAVQFVLKIIEYARFARVR
ncbi:Uncharacterised protein [Candidatus Anstonella stagnisolia]|nr:Uncharacterised protein [Candidatus Anstonella stagnisolia]